MQWHKKMGRGGHGNSGRLIRGTGGASGVITIKPRGAANDPQGCLNSYELSVFFRNAVGVRPSHGPAFMSGPIHALPSDTLRLAIQFIDQRPLGPINETAKKTLAEIRAKMKRALDEKEKAIKGQKGRRKHSKL